MTFPFAGGLLAVFLYECIFKRAEEAILHEDAEMDAAQDEAALIEKAE